MDKRPKLNKDISAIDFMEFYWLKKELLDFCRKEGLDATGSKLEIAERIKNYIITGSKNLTKPVLKSTSKFAWKNTQLSVKTEITDNYTNTENVRLFFEVHIGKQFKFNVKFMNWMKFNYGKTLGEAIEEWKSIEAEKKTRTQPKEIAAQFEYNKYMRDFFAENPNLERALGIKLWERKRSMRGDNSYDREDLKSVNEENK